MYLLKATTSVNMFRKGGGGGGPLTTNYDCGVRRRGRHVKCGLRDLFEVPKGCKFWPEV